MLLKIEALVSCCQYAVLYSLRIIRLRVREQGTRGTYWRHRLQFVTAKSLTPWPMNINVDFS